MRLPGRNVVRIPGNVVVPAVLIPRLSSLIPVFYWGAMMRGRKALWLVAALIVGAVAAGIRAVPYSAAYRNSRFARMSLEEQQQVQDGYVNDSIFLRHLGSKLCARGRFGEAVPVLERAVGLDPESV